MTKKQRIRLRLLPIFAAILGTAVFLLIELGNRKQTNTFDYSTAKAAGEQYEESLSVAVRQDCLPFSDEDEAGQPTGYDVELALLLGEKLGCRMEIHVVGESAACSGLERGDYDMVMGSVYTGENAARFRYSRSSSSDGYVFFGKTGGEAIRDTSQLYDKRIAVLCFSAAAEGNVLPVTVLGDYVVCASAENAFALIEKGDIDLLLTGRITGKAAQGSYDVEVLSRDMADASRYILTRPEDTELGNAVDAALQALKEDGIRDELENRWLHPYLHQNPADGIFSDYWWLLTALAAFIVLLLVGFFLLDYQRRRSATIDRLERNSLSGLLNRQAFCAHAAQELRRHPDEAYVICRVDIDRFKLYNESFGSEAGDRLIAGLGRLLRERQEAMGAVLFGHISGDDFVVLKRREGMDPQQDYQSFMELLQELDPNYTFTIHIGCCPIEDENKEISLACDWAFLAQRSIYNDYESHYTWYDEGMRLALLEERDLTNDMQQALEEEQFRPWFQPQYDYATGAIIGAEVLVRWQHPRKGLLPPIRFIPLFEKNGFIFEMDQCVWRSACAAIRRWKMQGLQIPPISVNLSRRDIYHRNLHQVLMGIVREEGLTPADLRLEITESAYLENREQLAAALKALSEAGFYLEMDDLGSGYSTLTTLKDMPFNLVKLDMGFLKGDNTEKSGSMLSSMVHMAHQIDLPVIAEGVETLEQAEYLKSLGCRYQQGYFFSKPMSEQDFEELLSSHRGISSLRASAAKKRERDYLDPAAQDALLFGTYACPSAVMDYSGNRVSILRANDRFYEAMGAGGNDRALNEDLLAALSEQQAHNLRAAMELAVQNGREAECEIQYRPDAKAHRQWVRCRVQMLCEKVTGYLLYMAAENITTERYNEERLRLREAEYRAAVHMSNDMVCRFHSIDRALVVTDETAAAFDSVTYMKNAPEEFLRQGYIAEDSRERWISLFHAIDAGEDSGCVNDIGISTLHSGEIRRYNASFTSIWGAEGQIQSAILSFHLLTGSQDNRALEQAQSLIQGKQKELQKQLHGFNELAATMHAGTWQINFDEDGRMNEVRWSQGVRELLGFRDEGDFPNTMDAWSSRLHAEDKERTIQAYEKLRQDPQRGYDVQYRLLNRDGEWRWFNAAGRAELREDGSLLTVFGILMDIGREKEMSFQLEEERSRYRKTLSALRMGTWYMEGKEPNALYADKTMCRLLGIPEDTDPETLFIYWRERLAPEDRLLAEQDVQRMQNGELTERLLRWNHPTFGYIYLLSCGHRDRTYQGEGVRIFGCTQNVDRIVRGGQESLRIMRKQLQEYRQAEYDQRRDCLTGLYNRQDLYACLNDAERPVMAVFKLDIDEFGEFNRKYGHYAGDTVLQKVGEALLKYGELNSITFYRYGGAQIMGLSYNNTTPNMTLAKEIVELVRNLKLNREDVPAGCITVSVGYTADAREPEQMPDKADAALRRAQEAGKNRPSA